MTSMKRTRVCARPGCGTVFEVKENQRNKKYCCPECAKIVRGKQRLQFKEKNSDKQREYMKMYRQKNKDIQKEETSSYRPCKTTTDWNAIVRICEEHKVSYGQAVAMNLIP